MASVNIIGDVSRAVRVARWVSSQLQEPMTVWRRLDHEQAYTIAKDAPDTPCVATYVVDPDGAEHWA